MKNLIETLPAAIMAIPAIFLVLGISVWDANKVDLDENKIESSKPKNK